jgi:hypothetical protein
MNKEQTPIEWIFEQFFNSFEKFNNGEYTFNDYFKRNLEIRKQAKEMFDKQVMNAWNNGFREFYDGSSTPEEYYNKTFKSE